MLLGSTRNGKSSTANTILGQQLFEVDNTPTSVTKELQVGRVTRDGFDIKVCDIPGLFDVKTYKKSIVEVSKKMPPGPNVVLFVFRAGSITTQDTKTVKILRESFGEKSMKYAALCITHIDECQIDKFERSIEQATNIKMIKEAVGKQIIYLNNNNPDNFNFGKFIN